MNSAALLQCALDDSFSDRPLGQDRREDDSGSVTAVSMASVSRHCGVMMKACVGLPWEAKVDVPYWLREMEKLKVNLKQDWGAGGVSTINACHEASIIGLGRAHFVDAEMGRVGASRGWDGGEATMLMLLSLGHLDVVHRLPEGWRSGCRRFGVRVSRAKRAF